MLFTSCRNLSISAAIKFDLDDGSEIKFFLLSANLVILFSLCGKKRGELLMVEVSEITLEKLLLFTGRSNTLITIDAPLFSSFMIFNGRVLSKGVSYVEPGKIGNSIGF